MAPPPPPPPGPWDELARQPGGGAWRVWRVADVRVASVAAVHVDGQPGQGAGRGDEEDAAARAAAAAGVVARRERGRATCVDRGRARDGARADEGHAASGGAVGGAAVVAAARAAAPAQDLAVDGHARERIAADAAPLQVAVPGVSAEAAVAGVGAAAAARVLVVRDQVGFGPAAAGVAGPAARHAAAGITFKAGVDGDVRDAVVHPARSAGDAFGLAAVDRVGGGVDVVGRRRADGVPRQRASGRAAEAEAVEVHGSAVQGQYPRDLEGQHAAGVSVPAGRSQGAGQGRGEVHGDANDLEGPLARRACRGRAVIGVDEAVVPGDVAVAADLHDTGRDRAVRDHVFVEARAVEGGDTVRIAGAGAVVRRRWWC